MKVSFISIIVTAGIALQVCSGCKKLTDSNGLPLATQEGRNTLGFLLNGQPWTPAGYDGGVSNLSLYYDESYRGGVFNISTYNLLHNATNDIQQLTFASDSIQKPQTITFGVKNFTVIFFNDKNLCDYSSTDTNTKMSGSCTITKLDKPNRIFAGTFDFVLIKAGCDTIKITEGRFDMKY